MICIYCGGKTRVANSRLQKRSNQTWRRRNCKACQGVFTTVEATDLLSSLLYEKGKTHIQPFSRDKLFISIYEACKHRKDAADAATALTTTIIGKLLPQIKNAALQRNDITSVTSEVLNRFDKVAGVQYGAYHPL